MPSDTAVPPVDLLTIYDRHVLIAGACLILALIIVLGVWVTLLPKETSK